MSDPGVEEAVRRNCEALIAGNLGQIFMDLTPHAMAKLSQSAGAQMGGPMPRLTGYEVVSREQQDGDHVYDVRFQGDVPFGVRARWRLIDNQWKLDDFEPYQYGDAAGGVQPQPPAS